MGNKQNKQMKPLFTNQDQDDLNLELNQILDEIGKLSVTMTRKELENEFDNTYFVRIYLLLFSLSFSEFVILQISQK